MICNVFVWYLFRICMISVSYLYDICFVFVWYLYPSSFTTCTRECRSPLKGSAPLSVSSPSTLLSSRCVIFALQLPCICVFVVTYLYCNCLVFSVFVVLYLYCKRRRSLCRVHPRFCLPVACSWTCLRWSALCTECACDDCLSLQEQLTVAWELRKPLFFELLPLLLLLLSRNNSASVGVVRVWRLFVILFLLLRVELTVAWENLCSLNFCRCCRETFNKSLIDKKLRL